MSTTTASVRFEFIDFVGKFPLVAMPITLGEDTHLTFSRENDPLSIELIEQFILPHETTPDDEFTEYVPCFAIDCDDPFIALVWWKAGLLNYEYYLATYTEKGELIQRCVIAGTVVKGEEIRRSVATIDADHHIVIVVGTGDRNDVFDATNSRTLRFDILPDGTVGKEVF